LNDVAVVGAGPAGISASIYLKRAGFEPLLFEHAEVGGLLLNANLVENYPGFPGGIRGIDLVNLFKRQLAGTGVKVTKTCVKEVFPESVLKRFAQLADSQRFSWKLKSCLFDGISQSRLEKSLLLHAGSTTTCYAKRFRATKNTGKRRTLGYERPRLS